MSERVCGVDVHRDLLVATIVGDSFKDTRRFMNDVDGVNSLNEWLKGNRCICVVMESSGVYWVSSYVALERERQISLTLSGWLTC